MIVLIEEYVGIVGEHYVQKAIEQKILCVILWWPTLHCDNKEFFRTCDVCQQVGKPSMRDSMPLVTYLTLQLFNKWEIDFVGQIKPPQRRNSVGFIITTTHYLMHWKKSCQSMIAT